MSGTTLCPHCNTRFKIAGAQLEAHHGMVRCGHCLQAFDARPGYIPDQPNPQLELPMPDERIDPVHADKPRAAEGVEETLVEGTIPAAESGLIEAIQPAAGEAAQAEPLEISQSDLLDFHQPVAVEDEARHPGIPPSTATPPSSGGTSGQSARPASARAAGYPAITAGEETRESPREFPVNVAGEPVAHPLTLAEQVAIVRDEDEDHRPSPRAYRRWPWAVASLLLLLALFAQAAYFFRVELAARLPGLKPALIAYCKLLGCGVPLPQNTDLMSIESSELEADPEHENQITLNALLRNRASYAQAFPGLELTLNDTQDKPLARRIFKPRDYLPPQESEQAGLLPNREITVKLYLNTADLRPTGYRLVLFYPR